MKKILTLSFLFIVVSVACSFGQETKTKAELLPDTVIGAFKAKYKKVEVDQWLEEDGNYKAVFKKGPAKYKATFNVDGKWLATSTEVDKDKVSGGIKKSLKNSDYKDWKIAKCEKTETPEVQKMYYVKVKKGKEEKTLAFDATGKMLDK
jgi:hypothetical protein